MFQRFRYVLPYFKKYRWIFGGGIFCLLLVNGLQQFLPLLLKKAIDSLRGGDALAVVALWAFLRLGVVLAMGALRYGWRMGLFGLARRLEYLMRRRLFGRLLGYSPAFFQRWRLGELLSRSISDLGALREFLGMGWISFLDGATLVPLTAWSMARLEPRLTLVCLAPLLATPILIVTLGPWVNRLNHETQEALDDLSQVATESFSGVRIIQAYAQENAEAARFDKACIQYKKKNLKVSELSALYWPLLTAFSGLATVLLFWLGGKEVISHRITLGSFVALLAYLEQLTWPVMALGFTVNLYQRGKTSIERLNEIFDESPEVQDARGVVEYSPGQLSPSVSGGFDGGKAIGFRFENVSFFYRPGQWVLEGIHLETRPGEWLGLAGETGSGKSSLLQLLLRFYDPQQGRIFLDGRELKTWLLPDLRKKIGYVSQEVFLFSESISENIAFGEPSVPQEELIQAAKLADLHDTVKAFPQGYETLLGERGINLSGGQKQRVALARALRLKPSLLLLDDSFSAVDTATEEEILKHLRQSLRGSSVVLVSHRISTLKACDRVLVLEKGRIAEQGSHEELLAKDGYYSRLAHKEEIARRVGVAF